MVGRHARQDLGAWDAPELPAQKKTRDDNGKAVEHDAKTPRTRAEIFRVDPSLQHRSAVSSQAQVAPASEPPAATANDEEADVLFPANASASGGAYDVTTSTLAA